MAGADRLPQREREIRTNPDTEKRPLLDRGLSLDAVLLDLLMSGMGGLAFLVRLRSDARYPALPVTIVTNDYFIGSTSQAAAGRLGANLKYKPVYPEEIVTIVNPMTNSVSC